MSRKGIAMPCMDPRFRQSIPKDEPLELLTVNSKWSGSLLYRNIETGQEYLVPNIWYNQPVQSRVGYYRWNGDHYLDMQRSYLEMGYKDLADGAYKNAVYCYEIADQMEQTGIVCA